MEALGDYERTWTEGMQEVQYGGASGVPALGYECCVW